MRKELFVSLRALGVLMMAVALLGSAVVFNGPQSAAAQTPLCLDTAQFGSLDTDGDDVISRDELLAAGATEAEADLAANFILNINCGNPIVIDVGLDGGDDGTDGTRTGDVRTDGTRTGGERVVRGGTPTVGGAAGEADQGGTPAADGEEAPIAPRRLIACQVEPRSANELLALWYGADGTPVAAQASPAADEAAANQVSIPVGPRADEATTVAVVTTIYEVFSCLESGDYLRGYALFTDELVRQFGPEPGTPREEAEAFLAATPEPEPEAGTSEIIAVANVMVLSDGRVGAVVVDRSDVGTNVAYVIFEQQGDRWLVDEIIEFLPQGGEEDEGA